MLPQRESILRLLADEDTETAELVEQQLVARGEAVLEDLKALLAAAHGRSERRLRETICEIERRLAEHRLTEICEGFHDESDIEEAAWTMAAIFQPERDSAAARAALDQWGSQLAARLGEAETIEEQVEILTDLLAGEARFHGNEEDYYAEENSLLTSVIETRLGIPISLSLLYMLVGRRAGIPVEGVALPGHFIVRLGHVFFDPFHAGRRMSLEECRKLLESQGIELHPHHLHATTPRVMLARMLNNLHHLARTQSDDATVEKITAWLAALQRSLR